MLQLCNISRCPLCIKHAFKHIINPPKKRNSPNLKQPSFTKPTQPNGLKPPLLFFQLRSPPPPPPKLQEKMGGAAPVEVGARGTVASLVMKEIEYFRRMELDRPGGSSRKPPGHIAAEAESIRSSNSRPSFSFPILTWRRWKKRRGSGILPSMCSAVEVADNGVPGFSYRNLKSDTEKYDDQF